MAEAPFDAELIGAPSHPCDSSPSVTISVVLKPRLARVLGIWTAISLVVGSVIGSGIFVKPGGIAAELGDFRWIMAVWVLGGILCVLGGLCFAELAAMMPGAGGMYVYIRRAYGPLGGFLLGWNEILFNKPASTGALAVIFADSLAAAFGLHLPSPLKALGAIVVVMAVAVINVRGVLWGGVVQNLTTWIKAGFLAMVGLLPFMLLVFGLPSVSWENYESTRAVPSETSFASRFGVALLAVMWAYNGWHAITPVAEEIRQPRRNIVRAILLGIGIIMVLYLMANIAYHGVLSMEEVAASGEQTAVEMLRTILGPVGAPLVAAIIMCSVFGAINSDLLGVPRISFAMGRDGLFFQRFADIHKKFRTPATAILIQALLSVALIVVSALAVEVMPQLKATTIFELLTNFAIFTASIFYVMTVMAVPILRWREPTARRPFRDWGYPATPYVFFAVYLWFLSTILFARPVESVVGVGLIAVGVPAYFWFARRRIPS